MAPMASCRNVQVVCRFRPQSSRIEKGDDVCVEFELDGISCSVGVSETQRFTFDRVFRPESTQQELFEHVGQPILSGTQPLYCWLPLLTAATAVLNGYNATLFAYGQTSSGKTHTLEACAIGPLLQAFHSLLMLLQGPDIYDPDTCGIVPRTVRGIFNTLQSADENVEFTLKVSIFEIYREKIRY